MGKLILKIMIISLLVGIFTLSNSTDSYAAANFYLSPASRTVSQGSTLSVAIRLSSSDAVNAVQTNLSYPADKLDFLSINDSGGALPMSFESSGGGGSVRIARMIPGTTVSGDKLVATVNFRAKVSSGSAVISFASGTAAANAGSPVAGGTSGGTYTFAAPLPPPPPPDTTPPKISDVKVTATSIKGATIEWKTDEAASSIVEYGVNNKYGLSAESAGATKDHKVSFTSEFLIPGLLFHFRVKSADAAGNMATGQDATFKALGIPVKVRVIDPKNKPVKGVKVTLASTPVTATTDKNGIANFSDVAPGKHLVSTEIGGKIQAFQIDVKEATDKEIAAGIVKPQSFDVKVISAGYNQLTRFAAATAAGLLVILGGGGFLWWYRSKKRPI